MSLKSVKPGQSHPAPADRLSKRRVGCLAFLFFLLTFLCIFCSAQSALLNINQNRISASMVSSERLNYEDDGPQLPPLATSIVEEALADAQRVHQSPTVEAPGIASLPMPLVFERLTPTPVALLSPTPTPISTTTRADNAPPIATPDRNPATAVADNPPPIPTADAPTAVPPRNTPQPTLPPATPVPPPTPMPPTIPPPTPTIPPTLPPVATATPVRPTPPPPTPRPTSPPDDRPTSPPVDDNPTATPTPTPTPQPPVVAFSQPTFTGLEGESAAVITVLLDRPAPAGVSIDYTTVDETALAGLDYQRSTGRLTFTTGQTQTNFAVPLIDDTIDELPETILLQLNNPVNALPGTPLTASLTIVDNDSPPRVQFQPAIYRVVETAGSLIITTTLSAGSALTVTANYETVNGTALAGADYVAQTGQLIFPPGQLSHLITVTLIDDPIVEAEEIFTLNLLTDEPVITAAMASSSRIYLPLISSPVGLTLTTPARQPQRYAPLAEVMSVATVTLISDDEPTIQFSQVDYRVNEAAGSANITVTLNTAANLTVTARYELLTETATPGSDYSLPNVNANLQFIPGQTQQLLTIPLTDDTFFEAAETLQIRLLDLTGATLGSPHPARLTIEDDDPPSQIQFSQAAYTLNEAAGAVGITVTLNRPTGLTATASYSLTAGTAEADRDYTPVSGTLVFPATHLPCAVIACTTEQTFTIPINNDQLDELSETVLLHLGQLQNLEPGTPLTATLTIEDDDPFPVVQFSLDRYFSHETNEMAVVTVTLTLPSALTTTVNLSTVPGNAQVGVDYQPISTTLTFAPGQVSQSISIPIINDRLNEANETFGVQLTEPNRLTVGELQTARVTIIDDDSRPIVSWSQSHYEVAENDETVDVTVTLNNPAGLPVTISYQTVDQTALGGRDYVVISSQLTIPAGQLSQTVTIPITDNQLIDGQRTFTMIFSDVENGILGKPSEVEVLIIDDDLFPTVQFVTSDYEGSEATGTALITVTLSQSLITTSSVTYILTQATAVPGLDYLPPGNNQLTFAPGQTQVVISVPIVDDAVSEMPESFAVKLVENPLNLILGQPNVALVKIVDND